MEGFRFTIPYKVRSADINYAGHVSNAVVLNYFQDVRMGYIANLGPYTESNIGGGLGIIIPEARIRYHKEMFFGEELEIGARVTSIGNASFEMAYRIERAGELVAEGTTAQVCFDYKRRQSCRIDPEFRERLQAFEDRRDS